MCIQSHIQMNEVLFVNEFYNFEQFYISYKIVYIDKNS